MSSVTRSITNKPCILGCAAFRYFWKIVNMGMRHSYLGCICRGMHEQWSLLTNLGNDVISTFGYVPYVGTLSEMTDFAHPHLDTHIPTHSHTFFFHIWLPHLATHPFSTFGCHTFFFHSCSPKSWWPTLLGKAGELFHFHHATCLFQSALRRISLEQ